MLLIIILSIAPLSHLAVADELEQQRFEDIVFQEQNTQLPDGGSNGVARPASTSIVISREEMAFIEMNTYLPGTDEGVAFPAGSEDTLSWAEIRFLEMNLVLPDASYPDAQPAGNEHILSNEELRFLEDNLWDTGSLARPAQSSQSLPPVLEPGKPF